MTAELILGAEDIVGESIVWDDRTERLLWVDIIGRRIHALTPATMQHTCWDTPDLVTSIGLRRDGGAIVGLKKTVCLWDFDDQFTPLATVEPELPDNRLNEGVVGPDGAFWVGTMQNNINPDGSPRDITHDTGRLYRCTADGQVSSLSEDLFGLTNTLVWTARGDLVTADTLKNELYYYKYDPSLHQLTHRRIFHSGFERGLPDGSVMDAEGFVWTCRVAGGSCLIRLNPNGEMDRVIELPCSWPTSCTFGGPDLDTLYITSARFTMGADHLTQHPLEGGLFTVKPGVKGTNCHRFGRN